MPRHSLTQEEQKQFAESRLLEGRARRPRMPDDKSKVGEPDRSRVAADQDYEVRQLVGKYGLSVEYARHLIARVGNDPVELDRVAKGLFLAASTF
jgi:Protein of unknown function (DUF3606)